MSQFYRSIYSEHYLKQEITTSDIPLTEY